MHCGLPALHTAAATFSSAVPPETDYAPSTHPSLWPQSWHKNIERVANPEETQQKKKKTHSDHTSDLPYICCIGVVTSSTPFLLWKVSGVGLCRPNNLVSIGIRDIYKDLFINIHY